MRSTRIGHLAANTEYFLRKKFPGKNILICSGVPANKALLDIFARKIKIVLLPKWKSLQYITRKITRSPAKVFFKELPFGDDDYILWNTTKTEHFFTLNEEKRGKELLSKIGVEEGWHICFHSRDASYLDSRWKIGDSYHTYRNSDINSFLNAAEYIVQQGGYAIRMGSKVDAALLINNPEIIDYATLYRVDFGDVYIIAKCKFFLGTTSGLICIAYMFDIPLAMANLLPLYMPPPRQYDLYIPKKIWDVGRKKYLSAQEMMDITLQHCVNPEKYGLQIIDNSSEEITDLCKEMNERLDKKWVERYTDLQEQYKMITGIVAPSMIGSLFLAKNKWFLEVS